MKYFIILFGLVILLSIVVLSGSLFHIWPTQFSDHKLSINDSEINQFSSLIQQRKFDSDMSVFYPGAPSENIRIAAEQDINQILSNLLSCAQIFQSKSSTLSCLKQSLGVFRDYDSEEKDRALIYIEEALSILKINNTHQLLNVWRYGFPTS